MLNNNRKMFDGLMSRTKIYLVIIAILLIVICILESKYILASIIIYTMIMIYSLWANNKRKSEISEQIQDLTLTVDSTAKKSLINSPFPLVILETNGNVIWKSSKFNTEFANTDISARLQDIVEDIKLEITSRENKKDKSIKRDFEIANKQYKILGEITKPKNADRKKQQEYMMILYFIDETEHIKLEKKYEDSNTCIGMITVDNYEEIMQRISEEDKPQVIAELEKTMYNWASETGGVMIKTDRDKFIYVFEQKYLKIIEENKFNILDIVKEINIEGRIQFTLSIAVSNEGDSNYEKYKSAISAMDIILGRGGDQAVVRENGKYTFFGGRAQEVEKRTKVKARIVAHALEELINESKDVIVMGHVNPDIDAFGAALGIYRLTKSLGKEANIVYNASGLTLENFMSVLQSKEEYKNVILDKNEALDKITSETLLVIVDTNKKNYTEIPELLEKTNKIVVIDHHRRSADYIDNSLLTFHEVYASSASELVTELLQYAEVKVNLTTIETEGLYAGIMMDTKNFTFKTGVRTFEAAAYLRKCGIDIIKVKKWFQSDLTSYNTIADIVKKAEITNDTIAISKYDKIDKDAGLICAKAADELLTISDITASFVIGNSGEKICISGRSIGDINVQLILEKLGGGGHITLAGAQVEGMTIDQVKEALKGKINEYFAEMAN